MLIFLLISEKRFSLNLIFRAFEAVLRYLGNQLHLEIIHENEFNLRSFTFYTAMNAEKVWLTQVAGSGSHFKVLGLQKLVAERPVS